MQQERADLELELIQQKVERARYKTQSALLEGARGTYGIRPSHIYPCRTFYNELRGAWVCEFQGDETAHGVGDCPLAAMVAFDNMWNGDKDDAGMDG